MDLTPPPNDALNVPLLLESSEPRPRFAWGGYALVGFILVLFFSSLGRDDSLGSARIMQVFSVVLMLFVLAGLPVWSAFAVRALRDEQQQVEAVGELIQLRRWPQALLMLQAFLSRPARSARLRSQGLIYLGILLGRFHRFTDAVAVNTYLIDNDLVDPATAYGLRLGRTLAMLREDHLFDADRAISELRRLTAGGDSAGLALVQIYRDVKTGHPEDAIALFNDNLPILREQLGHRAADAYALVARAYDLLDRREEAALAFSRATCLAPSMELLRRYPELEKLVGRYTPAPAPAEAL